VQSFSETVRKLIICPKFYFQPYQNISIF